MTTTRHIAHAVGATGSDEPAFRVELRAGRHHLVADEPTPAGGGDLGPSPFGLLSSALVACTAMTLRMYADRKGWDLMNIDVDVQYDVDESGEESIRRTIALPETMPAEQRDRLADIADRTPVTRAIRTPISTTIELRESEAS